MKNWLRSGFAKWNPFKRRSPFAIKFKPRTHRLRLENLERRITPAFNTIMSGAATSGVSVVTAAGTTTYTAIATGANINVADVGTELAAGNKVVIDTGSMGGEAGNFILTTPNTTFANAAGTSLTIQTGSGADLVGDITLESLKLSNDGSIILISDHSIVTKSLEANVIDLTAATGSVSSTGTYSASKLSISASTGIGSSGAKIATQVSNFEAVTSTGGIYIAETDSLNIGGASAGIDGVQATTSGDIEIKANGSIILDGSNAEDIRTKQGNVLVEAFGASANVELRNASADAIDSDSGKVTIIAGQDLLLGDATTDRFGDVESNGALVLMAGRDIIVDENSFVDAFGLGNTITITAAGNVRILSSDGTTGSRIKSQSGVITVTTGSGGTFETSSGVSAVNSDGNGGPGADININADRMIIDDEVNAGVGNVSIRQVLPGQMIDLGSTAHAAPDTLELSDQELNEITAAKIIIGSSSNLGNISISSNISLANTTHLELETAGSIIDNNAAGTDITVATLAMTAFFGIATVADPLETAIDFLEATTTLGDIAIENLGTAILTIGDVNSTLNGVSTSGGDIFINHNGDAAGGDIAINEPISNSGGGNIKLSNDTSNTIGATTIFVDAPISATGGSGSVSIKAIDFVEVTAPISVVGLGTITIEADFDDDLFIGFTFGGDFTNNASGTLTTEGGFVDIRAFDIDLGGAINVTTAPGSEVRLAPHFDMVVINLGADIDFGLTDTDLDFITADVLRIGSATNTDGIVVSDSITGTSYSTLSLETAGSISETTPLEQTDLTVTSLALRSGKGIGSADDLDIAVTNLAFNNAAGAVGVSNTGLLTVNVVDGLATSANNGTTTNLTADSPLIFAVNTTTVGDTTYTAGETNDPLTCADDLILTAGVVVSVTAGNLTLQAGDDIVFSTGSSATASGALTLTPRLNDLDGCGSIVVEGTTGNDDIIVGEVGGNTVVTINGVQVFSAATTGLTELNINGLDGDDTLTINFANYASNFPVAGLIFDGGSGSNRVVTFGGNFDTGVSTPTGPNSGSIVYSGGTTGNATITYLNLTPIDDLNVVANYTINATAVGEEINIVDGPIVMGTQTTQVNSGASGTFELINFANKPNVTVNGLAGVDTVTVNVKTPAVGLTNLTVDTGDGDDSVTVLATSASFATSVTSTVSSGGNVPTDTVAIGDAGSVQAILGAVNVTNPPARTTLIIDDSADGTSRNVTISDSSITGLAPATISYSQSDLNALTVSGGTGGNTFTVTGTPSNGAGALVTTLNSGTGADVVNVQATGGLTGAKLLIQGQNGADTVNVGSLAPALGGTLANINGVVRIQNASSFSTVNIDDSGDATARNATLDTILDGAQLFGQLTGLSNPAAIQYAIANTGDVSDVIINAGSGGNTFTINQAGATAAFTTTLNAGTGVDVVNVLATSSNVTYNIQGQSGNDTVNIGDANSVQNILGNVNILNSGAQSTVNVDDSADMVARTVTVTNSSITGLAPATIGYKSGEIDTLTIFGGTGGNTFTITSTITGTTIVNSGNGSDTFTIDGSGLGTNSTNNFNGQDGDDSFVVSSAPPATAQLNIDGGIGNDKLTAPDLANVWNLTGLGSGNIVGVVTSFTNLENLTGGSDVDSFVFANNTAGVTGVIDGGAGVDLLDYSALNTDVSANLGISTTNAAILDGAQVVPPNSSTSTGTATFTFNAASRTFDITLTVTGILATDAGLVIQLQQAIAGVNGPVIITLFSAPGAINLGTLTPTIDGFTFTATNVPLPAGSEVAFLADNTYLNIQSTAFPTGEIRGQVIRQTQAASTMGTATGTGNITNIENVTGGSGNDNLVGSPDVNTLIGNDGNDSILGGQGADVLNGGAGDDLMAWANGDGSDVMDGGAGTDTTQVNGSVGATGDAFLVQPGAGGRLEFQRTNLGTFTLDIGTVEVLTLNGNAGSETMTVNSLTGVADLTTINMNGGADADTFNVVTQDVVVMNVDGDTPTPPAMPGDTLNVDVTGATSPSLTVASSALGMAGNYAFGNRATINFQEVETLSPAGTDLAITITDNMTDAIPGTTITYTIVVTNNGLLNANGAKIIDMFPAILTNITFTAVGTGGATGFTASGAGNINDLVDMPVGSTITYTVTATIASSATGTLVNTATVENPAGQPDPNPANNTATDTNNLTPRADLSVSITATPNPVFAGSNITYTIVVNNLGPSDAVNVTLSDLLPANTTFVSFVSAAGWSFNVPPVGGTGSVTATRAALVANSGAQTFTLVVRVNTNVVNNSVISNTVAVNSATVDPNQGNNMATATTTVRLVPLPMITGADAGGGPQVIVYNAFTGELQFSFYAYDENFTGGVRVAAGDVTGDGIPDILTGAGPGGGPHVKVFDGVTGAEVRSFFAYDALWNGGLFIASGDINGDGFADIITGADAGGGPHVIVFSGATGAILQSFYAYDVSFTGGVRVAGGDIDGDGRADIVTGAGPGGGPHVEAFSGATGALIRSFYAYDPAFTGGVYVSAGDINNDGQADFITGAGAGAGPHALVYSGANLAIIHSFAAFDPAFTGGVRVGVADLGGDGQLDILTGAGPMGGPQVLGRRGTNLELLTSFYAYDPAFLGGVFVG